ncbi:RDD family protein [Shewanella sp. HL-SH4]|uniref:RDD family protein n=1 Tax=Shewanella sp. HL-SH4 TaxID=3436240 RepID=UPI003EC143E2
MSGKNECDKIAEDLRNRVSYENVGFFKRILALIIDFFLLNMAWYLFGCWAKTYDSNEMTTSYVLSDAGLLMLGLYYLVIEATPLQGTLGKFVLGIKVCDEFNNRITIRQNMLRNLGRIFTFFTMLLGYITVPFRKDKRALHDLVSDTYVLKKYRS